MENPDTSAASSASKANSPVTMIAAGLLALALGGLGVAAWKMNKGAPVAMAEDPQSEEAKAKAKAEERKAADEAAQAAVAKSGTPSKAAISVAPKEDPALGASGVRDHVGGDYSDDASLK